MKFITGGAVDHGKVICFLGISIRIIYGLLSHKQLNKSPPQQLISQMEWVIGGCLVSSRTSESENLRIIQFNTGSGICRYLTSTKFSVVKRRRPRCENSQTRLSDISYMRHN